MAIPLLAVAAIAAGTGLVKSYIGARQAKKGREMAEKNTRPDFDIADEYYTNQAIAQNMAQSGLGQSSLDYYTDQASRGLTSSADTLLQTGGGPNAVGALYNNYQQGIGSIAAADAQAKRQNINNLMAQNAQVAEQETMKWSVNKYEPYKDTARAASELQATGTQNIFNGLSQVGSAAASYYTGGLYQAGQAGNLAYQNPQTNPETAISNVLPSGAVQAPNYNMGQDTSGYDANSLINEGLSGMEKSPYRDYIRRMLQQQYGRVSPGMTG